MTDEHRMERIENMLYDVRFLSYDEFLQHEKYLKDLQGKPEHSGSAGLLLAMLYNKRANEYHELAKPLARTALQQIPGKKDAHNAIFDAEHGPYQDWNFINHGELILRNICCFIAVCQRQHYLRSSKHINHFINISS